MQSNIYIAPLQSIYSEALSALVNMMLNVIMNGYVQSISKPKHSRLKESPEVGPRTHVEPANGSHQQMAWMFRIPDTGYVNRVE